METVIVPRVPRVPRPLGITAERAWDKPYLVEIGLSRVPRSCETVREINNLSRVPRPASGVPSGQP